MKCHYLSVRIDGRMEGIDLILVTIIVMMTNNSDVDGDKNNSDYLPV